jgi:choline-sulfatase
VVMADHGEAFGEHKIFFHGQDLFDEQLRVPLIIAVPGQAPRVIEDDVALVDVAPTLLDLVGAPVPAAMRGRSLVPRIEGAERPARPVFAELLPATAWPHHAVMMVDGGMKIIHRVSDRRWELYDLGRDPGEKKNLAEVAASHQTFESLRGKLLAFEERPR